MYKYQIINPSVPITEKDIAKKDLKDFMINFHSKCNHKICPRCNMDAKITINDGGSSYCNNCDIYYHFCKKTNKSEEVKIHKCETCNPFKNKFPICIYCKKNDKINGLYDGGSLHCTRCDYYFHFCKITKKYEQGMITHSYQCTNLVKNI